MEFDFDAARAATGHGLHPVGHSLGHLLGVAGHRVVGDEHGNGLGRCGVTGVAIERRDRRRRHASGFFQERSPIHDALHDVGASFIPDGRPIERTRSLSAPWDNRAYGRPPRGLIWAGRDPWWTLLSALLRGSCQQIGGAGSLVIEPDREHQWATISRRPRDSGCGGNGRGSARTRTPPPASRLAIEGVGWSRVLSQGHGCLPRGLDG